MRRTLTGIVAVLAMALILPVAPATAQDSLVEKIGEFEAIGGSGDFLDGALVVNSERRRMYQIDQLTEASGTVLQVHDLDSLDVIGEIPLGRVLYSAPDSRSDPHIAIDEEGGRLFAAYLKGPGDPGLAGVLVVDEETGEVTDQPLTPALQVMGLKIGGMSYSPQDQRLYFLLRNNTPPDPEFAVNQTALSGQTPRIFIMTFNPETGQQEILRYVRACRNLFPNENPSGHYELPIFRSSFEQAVWFACSNSQGGFQIIRIGVDALTDPAGTEDVFPGPERVRDALADPNSDRIYARYSAALGESWWVFDGQERSWVGVIGASKTKDRLDYSAGVDESSGRLYLHYPGLGLLMADARRTPVPQALVFPEIEKGPNPQRIAVDSQSRRFFIRASAERWDVLRDTEPVPPPPPPDPDENTTDVPEEEGKTDVSFTGTGQGYGVRTLLIGGAFGVVPPGPGAEDARPLRALLNRTGTQCGPRDRELAFGVIEKGELSNAVASVRAQAAKTDEGTNQDLQNPSRCDIHPDPGPPLGSGTYPGIPEEQADQIDQTAKEELGWDGFFASSECSGNQDPDQETSRDPVEGMRVEVTCNQEKSKASAEAGGPAIETDTLKVGTTLSRMRMFRDERRGIVSQVYSVARGIEIGDLVKIDAVETWGEASANGREKKAARQDTASARFVRRITGAKVFDPEGNLVFSCDDCSRDLQQFIGQANNALTGRAEIRTPMPDPVLLAGTPGGFQAAVQKDRFQQITDNALNNDPSREVPGLEIISINDSPELRARQVTQLAGVAAGSSYGIFLLNRFSFDFDAIPQIPDVEPLPVGAEVTADPDFGTTVSEVETAPPPRLEEPSVGDRVRDLAASIPAGAAYMIRNPLEAALATLVWLVLALPIYGFVRRRSLLKTLDSGTEQ